MNDTEQPFSVGDLVRWKGKPGHGPQRVVKGRVETVLPDGRLRLRYRGGKRITVSRSQIVSRQEESE